MRKLLTRLSIVFTAGVIGAVANSLALQLVGLLRPGVAPPVSPGWIYQRLLWGGLWGFLLLLPILPGRPVARGLLVSVAPAIARLTVFAPAGGPSGALVIVFVFVFNAIWGAVAGLWERSALL